MLVPVAVCVYIISAVIKKVLSVLAPIAKLLHVESVEGIAIVELAAILVVISACFLFGLMIRTTVLVRVWGSRQIGFLVEEHSSGEVMVFIPAAPAVSVGAVQVVKAELVEKLDVSMRKVFDCITQLGIGPSTLTSMPQAPARHAKNDG